MFKNALKDLLDPFCFRASLKRFQKLQFQLLSPETRLALPFVYQGWGHYRKIMPMQVHSEIAGAYEQIKAFAPKTVLEIGTCHGGSLYLWAQVAAADATLISLDLPGGEYGGGYHPAREKFYKQFAQPGQTMHLLRGDSHTQESFEKVKALLGDKQVDFLFIDGDHSYEGVKHDYELYSPLVRDGGIIGLHDIAPRKEDIGIDVERFWREIREQYPNAITEFINVPPPDRTLGIGLLQR